MSTGENKFKTGSLVQLKSGSPKMVVRCYVSDNNVQCDWFSGNDFFQKTFLEDQLEDYTPPSYPKITGVSRNKNRY